MGSCPWESGAGGAQGWRQELRWALNVEGQADPGAPARRLSSVAKVNSVNLPHVVRERTNSRGLSEAVGPLSVECRPRAWSSAPLQSTDCSALTASSASSTPVSQQLEIRRGLGEWGCRSAEGYGLPEGRGLLPGRVSTGFTTRAGRQGFPGQEHRELTWLASCLSSGCVSFTTASGGDRTRWPPLLPRSPEISMAGAQRG